jgi:hypothetical protein
LSRGKWKLDKGILIINQSSPVGHPNKVIDVLLRAVSFKLYYAFDPEKPEDIDSANEACVEAHRDKKLKFIATVTDPGDDGVPVTLPKTKVSVVFQCEGKDSVQWPP